MFYIDQRTNKITITKGDNAQIVVSLFDKDDKPRELYEDDVLTMTVKKSGSNSPAFTKTADNGVINIVPTDTKSLATGYYYYDLQLTTFGGSIYTIIPATLFEIREEITV